MTSWNQQHNEPYYVASDYISKRWHIFPLPPGTKIPNVPWTEYREEFMSPAEMHQCFVLDSCNMAIITGPCSNLTVIDCDSRSDEYLMDSIVPPNTPKVRTRKGAHYYFRFNGEKNGVGITMDTPKGPVRFDVRGDGGYVVAPPSAVRDWTYRWTTPVRAGSLTTLPENLRETLRAQHEAGLRFAKHKEKLAGGVSEGGRNNFLASYIGYLIHHLPPADIDVVAASAHAMNQFKNSPPLPDAEVEATLNSILNREARK